MNILHVLSQFEVTGAETYAATLADLQTMEGRSVFVVSDTFHTPTMAEVFLLPIGNRNHFPETKKHRKASQDNPREANRCCARPFSGSQLGLIFCGDG